MDAPPSWNHMPWKKQIFNMLSKTSEEMIPTSDFGVMGKQCYWFTLKALHGKETAEDVFISLIIHVSTFSWRPFSILLRLNRIQAKLFIFYSHCCFQSSFTTFFCPQVPSKNPENHYCPRPTSSLHWSLLNIPPTFLSIFSISLHHQNCPWFLVCSLHSSQNANLISLQKQSWSSPSS